MNEVTSKVFRQTGRWQDVLSEWSAFKQSTSQPAQRQELLLYSQTSRAVARISLTKHHKFFVFFICYLPDND